MTSEGKSRPRSAREVYSKPQSVGEHEPGSRQSHASIRYVHGNYCKVKALLYSFVLAFRDSPCEGQFGQYNELWKETLVNTRLLRLYKLERAS